VQVGTCSTHGCVSDINQKREQLLGLGVHGMIILRLVFDKKHELDSAGLENESSDSVK
jgi:hypothetical protein